MAQHNPKSSIIFSYFILCVVMFSSIQPVYSDYEELLRPETIPTPQDNPLTPDRIVLGKALFFDPRLSDNNDISCASCHQPNNGWASNILVSKLKQQKIMYRRAVPTLINVAYQRHYGWDGQFTTLEQQAIQPITSAHEMNQDSEALIKELSQIVGYQIMFEQAYPNKGITIQTIAKAIASFERSIVSNEAPFDRWVKGDEDAISVDAKRGFNLFEDKANCIACHHGFNFTDNGFHNIGVTGDDDPGRFALLPAKILKGAFKTPTLRDVTLTAPYMHNNKYQTLEEVIEHYDRGGDLKTAIDPNIGPLFLSHQEKKDLLAFLKTLTATPGHVTAPSLTH